MTIDETIMNKKNNIKEWEEELYLTPSNDITHIANCKEIIKNYKQEINWLEELKAYKTCNEGKFIHYKESVAYDKGYAEGFNDGCAKFSVGQDYEDGYKQAIEDFVCYVKHEEAEGKIKSLDDYDRIAEYLIKKLE